MKNLSMYLKLYQVFLKNSLSVAMEYRFNFIMGILIETAFLVIKVSFAVVVYKIGLEINGLSPDAILLFIGTYTVLTGFMMLLFYFNFVRIPEYVRNGDLDLLITKPISLQFYATLRFVDISTSIPNVVGGLIMIILAWSRLNLEVGINLIGYILMMLWGLVLTYSILIIPTILSFWIVKNQAIHDITYALWDFNNMPMSIYGGWIQRVGVFVVPILVVTNFPSMYLLGKLSTIQCIWGIVIPIIAFIVARLFWNHALKQYTSASS